MSSLYLPNGSKIGAGYAAHLLANAMISRGHRVTMYSPCSKTVGGLHDDVQVPITGSLPTFKWGIALGRLRLSGFELHHGHGHDHFRRGGSIPHN